MALIISRPLLEQRPTEAVVAPGESAAKSILYYRVHCTFSTRLPVKEGDRY